MDIERLLGANIPSISEIEKMYPPRPEGEIITRVGPSPTGFMHIGSVYASLIPERIAHRSGGKFFLRIEDTDAKREVEGAAAFIMKSLEEYGIHFDESPMPDGSTKGDYGPYIQSQREHIYKAYIKDLLERGLAYPCFCTPEELDKIRNTQKSFSKRTGYYGEWALHRSLSEKEIKERLDAGQPYVIRFKSHGKFDDKITYTDLVKGRINTNDNQMDIVIMKANGLPTYHFAHIIDDHLMGTTHVIRGDEWVPSVALHLQLFKAMGWKAPEYGHLSPIQKIDDEGNKRKLSKRSDPEATMSYYGEKGYPIEAVLEYLLNLANSSFEPFRKENPDVSMWEFPFEISGMNKSGALLDLAKLDNIAKEFVARLSAEEIYDALLKWSAEYQPEVNARLAADKQTFISIFEIERKDTDRVRKDISQWSTVWEENKYFFDDQFKPISHIEAKELLGTEDLTPVITFVKAFLDGYDHTRDAETWFPHLKELAIEHNYAKSPKVFKKEPENYIGSIADAAKVLRIALTGRAQTPDLRSVMTVMGEERVRARIQQFIEG